MHKRQTNDVQSPKSSPLIGTYGDIPGAPVGSSYARRANLSSVGVHTPLKKAIHCGDQGLYSLLLCDGLATIDDDLAHINVKVFPEDKYIPLKEGLLKSLETCCPIRVIRSSNLNSAHAPHSGFQYDGLYQVSKHWVTKNIHNFMLQQGTKLGLKEKLKAKPKPVVPFSGNLRKRFNSLLHRGANFEVNESQVPVADPPFVLCDEESPVIEEIEEYSGVDPLSIADTFNDGHNYINGGGPDANLINGIECQEEENDMAFQEEACDLIDIEENDIKVDIRRKELEEMAMNGDEPVFINMNEAPSQTDEESEAPLVIDMDAEPSERESSPVATSTQVERSDEACASASGVHNCKYSKITLGDFLKALTPVQDCPCLSSDHSFKEASSALLDSVANSKETPSILNAFFNLIELLQSNKDPIVGKFLSERLGKLASSVEDKKSAKRRKKKRGDDSADSSDDSSGGKEDWEELHYYVPFQNEIPKVNIVSFEDCVSGLINELEGVDQEVWTTKVVMRPKRVIRKPKWVVEKKEKTFEGFSELELKDAKKKRDYKHGVYLDLINFHGWSDPVEKDHSV